MSFELKNKSGFTIVELIISVGIFALMTALLVTKYGNFNQGILLNNLAYDIALNIRNAQSYGLNVKSAPASSGGISFSNEFNYPYGVYFETDVPSFKLFADVSPDNMYDGNVDYIVSSSRIKNIARISNICVMVINSCNTVNNLNIVFKRPDPNAIIIGDANTTKRTSAEITVMSTDGSSKKIVVRSNGQIAVE